MRSHKLFIYALVVLVGAMLVSFNSTPSYADDTNKPKKPTPSASPDGVVGKPINLIQSIWFKENKSDKAAVAEQLPVVRTDGKCGKDDNPKILSVSYSDYRGSHDVNFVDGRGSFKSKGKVKIGNDTGVIDGYVISNGFTSNRAKSVAWNEVRVTYSGGTDSQVKLAYRTSNNDANQSVTEADNPQWKEATLTETRPSTCKKENKVAVFTLTDVQAKYFQYKVTVKGQYVAARKIFQSPTVQKVAISLQPTNAKKGGDDDGGGDKDKDKKEGKLTVSSVKIVEEKSDNGDDDTTATPASDATTEQSAPLPQDDKTTDGKPKLIQPQPTDCSKLPNTDPEPGIGFKFKQTQGGEIKVEDQETDEDGEWKGLDGKVDAFPEGQYRITFDEIKDTNFKLVAICVSKNDVIKSELDVKNRQATFLVKKGHTTKVVAVYGPRIKPHIDMQKFAIEYITATQGDAQTAKRKVLRLVYPGQKFTYLIRYENTGGADAKDVVIKDVVPSPLRIPESAVEQLIDNGYKISPDPRGHTLVTKTIAGIKAGETGSVMIPVELPGDAFTSDGTVTP